MDAGIGVAALEMPRRLLDRLPRLGLRRPRRRRHGALADLGADVEDDDSLDQLGPLGREVHRGAPAHREPDQRERAQAELLDDTREVAEGAGRVVDVGGIAVAVAARVERHHVEVRLQRDGERVPGVGVAGEAVQQQQRRAAVAAPVQQVQAPSVEGEVALARAQEAHRSSWGAPRWPPRSFKRKGLRPPRTPPAIARTRPGGAVARLGLDTGWLITAPRLHQSVELPRVIARDLVRDVGRQVAELLGDVLRRLRPDAVGMRVVGAPHERLDADVVDQLGADPVELKRGLALPAPVVARLHREAEIAEAVLPLEVHPVQGVGEPADTALAEGDPDPGVALENGIGWLPYAL